jgi:hypothetical protein
MFSRSLIVGERKVPGGLRFRVSSEISPLQRSLHRLSFHLRCFVPDAEKQSFRGNTHCNKPGLCGGNRGGYAAIA